MKKTAPSVVLSGLVLIVGWGDDSRHQAYSGEPLAAESAQRSAAQESHEDAPTKPREPEAIFPGIKPAFRAANLRLIEGYCQQGTVYEAARPGVLVRVKPANRRSCCFCAIPNRELTSSRRCG